MAIDAVVCVWAPAPFLGVFFPTLTCGVFVFSSVSAPPRPPSFPSSLPPPSHGLPHLLEADQKRVCAANNSYSAMVTLILFLITFGIGVSIENPRNSILWLSSTMTRLFDQFWGHDTFFDHCMHGGTRDKSTRWWSYNPRVPQVNLFASLSLQCDKQHQHASWKPIRQGKRVQFPTAEEAKYPFILCQRVAFILKQEAAATTGT